MMETKQLDVLFRMLAFLSMHTTSIQEYAHICLVIERENGFARFSNSLSLISYEVYKFMSNFLQIRSINEDYNFQMDSGYHSITPWDAFVTSDRQKSRGKMISSQ